MTPEKKIPTSELHLMSEIGIQMISPAYGFREDILSATTDTKEDRARWERWKRDERISRIENIAAVVMSIVFAPFWLYTLLLITGMLTKELQPIMSSLLGVQLGILLAMVIIMAFPVFHIAFLAIINWISGMIQKRIAK